jgi:hypothetical protein
VEAESGFKTGSTVRMNLQQDIGIILLQRQGISTGIQCCSQKIYEISWELVQEFGMLGEFILDSRSGGR